MITIKDLYIKTKEALEEGAIPNNATEARRLIAHVLNVKEDIFITNADMPIAEEQQLKSIDDIIKRRIAGEPLSKIIGTQEFWGLPFYVTKDTLDPRPDTETLIEAVLDYCNKNNLSDKPLKILDLGTGTGCILISLLSELPKAIGVGVDYSQEALDIAQTNIALNNLNDRINLIQSDWCASVTLADFDIIVSNPPYIREDVIPQLSEEVKNHDPILALLGGKTGLDAYEKILFSVKSEKNVTARLFLEIGFDQLNDLVRLADDSNLRVCDSRTDLAGNPRVVEIACGDK